MLVTLIWSILLVSIVAENLYEIPPEPIQEKVLILDKNSQIEIIKEESKKHGLDWRLAVLIAESESNFNQTAVSSVGAIGIFQIMPSTAKDLGIDPNCPKDNIKGGVKYISNHIKYYKDVRLALAAYNAGSGNVAKYGGVPPFKETKKYIARICSRYNCG